MTRSGKRLFRGVCDDAIVGIVCALLLGMAKRNARQAAVEAAQDRSLDEIRAIYMANAADPTKGSYDGLTTSEIALWNRRLMFGANDEAFPSQEDWSRIVD